MLDYKIITLSKTNCYLLKAKVGYLLIDCGSDKDAYALLKSVHDLGLTLKDIRYLFLTHHHNDHCGLLSFLVTENPEIRIILSDKCAEILKTGIHFKDENEKYSSPILRLVLGLYFKVSKNTKDTFIPYVAKQTDYIITADEETILPKIGIEGKILLTPGHTADSISLITEETAFVGDASRNMLNFAGAAYKPLLIYNADLCNSSLNHIVEEGAKVICPAHGDPFSAEKIKLV